MLTSFGLTVLIGDYSRRDPMIPYPVGLERDGEILLKPFCPPYFDSMTDAVKAVVEAKFGSGGVFGNASHGSAWVRHSEVAGNVLRVSEAAIPATTAHCEYIWERYGRFPAGMPPHRTVLGFQACHLDREFYEKFYKPGSLPAGTD